ncbi:MAG: glycosyltransferase family 4 protein [Azospirillaceae bacterium]|nr:glycosyltransferase family 4 protein [Azospirillaceae bacterium]
MRRSPVPNTPPDRLRILYLVTEDWYFWSHRLPMARAARDAGFDVAVATRVTAHGARIEAEGFRLLPLPWRRRSIAPFREIAAILRLYRTERPDLVHHVAVKPSVYGAVAAWLSGVPAVVNAIAGLGYVFTARDLKARLLRLPLGLAFRLLLGRRNARVLLQNPDDRDVLTRSGLVPRDRIRIVRGSGIDTDWFRPLAEPEGAIGDAVPTIAVVTRMLKFKGVARLVEAQQILSRRGIACRLILAGAPDGENPAAIDAATLTAWGQLPGVEWRGHVEDVRAIWRQAVIAAFVPLGGEGLPKTLLEAAACGRPIVASDVAGCREIAIDGVNALLVPPDDAPALADALARLLADGALRQRLGAAGRHLVETEFSADRIGRETVALYRELLADPGSPAPDAVDRPLMARRG